MTTLRPAVAARAGDDFADIADATSRALVADAAAIVTWGRPGRPPRVLGVAGIALDELERLAPAVEVLRVALGERSPLALGADELRELSGAEAVAELGFAEVAAAALDVEGRLSGAICVLKRGPGRFENEELIESFARQTAVAIAHRRLRRATASLAERVERLEALDQIALSAASFRDLMAELETVVLPATGAEMMAIMVWDEEHELLQMVGGSFWASEPVAASYQISAYDPHSNAARVFTTGRPYISNDAVSDRGILREYVEIFDIERLLSLRLQLAGRPIGVLHLANKRTDFTVADLERAEMLAPRIATVVELARTVFRLRRQRSLEGILSNVAVAIASGESIRDFLIPAMEELREATQTALLALVPEGPRAELVARGGGVRPELERRVLAEAREATGMRAYVVGPRQAGDPGRAALFVPVHLAKQRIGALAALRRRGEPLAQDERQALARLANLAGLAWASERDQEQRAQLARLEERQRIADDLHDDVAQILYAGQLQLDSILARGPVEPAVEEGIVRARALLIRGDTAIRTVIHQLSQPREVDLPEQLATVAAEVEREFAVPVRVTVSEPGARAAGRLAPRVGATLVRAAREALVNAAKHAGPCEVATTLDVRSGALALDVVDDGIGLPAGHDGGQRLTALGRDLRAHGGTLAVLPEDAGGTRVTATVPL